MKKNTIMVLGANGFLGRNFVGFIRENSLFDVIYEVDSKRKLSEKNKKNFIECNITDQKALKKVLTRIKPGYIFHFAGLTHSNNWEKLYEANVETTSSLFESVKSMPEYRPRITIVGSAAEYGHIASAPLPIKENFLLNPDSKYGISMVWRYYIAEFYKKAGFDVVSCRIFNILGPALPEKLSIGSFAKQIVAIEKGKQKPFVKAGRLTTSRDFLDVLDVVRAVFLVGLKGKSGEVYNICSGKSENMRKILNICLKHSSKKGIKIIIDPARIRKADVRDICGDNKKIKKNTGWQPRVTLEKSIKRTLDYYRNADKYEN